MGYLSPPQAGPAVSLHDRVRRTLRGRPREAQVAALVAAALDQTYSDACRGRTVFPGGGGAGGGGLGRLAPPPFLKDWLQTR